MKLLEWNRFPRFHIGESLLPRNLALLRELGLLDALAGVPKVAKYGAEFILGSGGEASLFRFVEQSSAAFFHLVDLYYDHSFRELS